MWIRVAAEKEARERREVGRDPARWNVRSLPHASSITALSHRRPPLTHVLRRVRLASAPTHCARTAQTLVDLARIRVLVVPVGPVAPAKFNAYLSLIRQFSAVALSDLSFNNSDSVPGA